MKMNNFKHRCLSAPVFLFHIGVDFSTQKG